MKTDIKTGIKHYSTGFDGMDDLTGGGITLGVTAIAGSPGVGKTSFALQISHYAAEKNMPILYFTGDMYIKTLKAKMISREMFTLADSIEMCKSAIELQGPDLYDNISRYERELLTRAKGRVAKDRIVFVEGKNRKLSVDDFVLLVDTFCYDAVIPPLIVIDSIDEIFAPHTVEKRTKKQYVLHRIKEMSERNHIPVIILMSIPASMTEDELSIEEFKLRYPGIVEFCDDIFALKMEKEIDPLQNVWDIKLKGIRTMGVESLGEETFKFYPAYSAFRTKNVLADI